MIEANDRVVDLYRAGLNALFSTTKMSLEAAERLHKRQLEAITATLTENANSVRQITDSRDVEQLLSTQRTFVSRQLEQAMSYWGGFCQVAGENQVEILKQAQSQATEMEGRWKDAMASAPQAAERVLAPLQSVVEAFSSAYAQTAQNAQEATKTAVAAADTATAEIRSNEARANEVLANAARSSEAARKRA
jgi:phasin family protein